MCVYIYIYIYIYVYVHTPRPRWCCVATATLSPSLAIVRGWQNTVEIVLFEISNSMKPYPSVFHTYINHVRPMVGFLSQTISMRFPTVFRPHSQ